MSFQASSFEREARKIARLDPPANDTPGHRDAVRRRAAARSSRVLLLGREPRRNSPRFQGPVIHIAIVPRANSW